MNDLFAPRDADANWRSLIAPEARLAAFAADGTNPSARRREANSALTLYLRRIGGLDANTALGSTGPRPLGLLMLVPPA